MKNDSKYTLPDGGTPQKNITKSFNGNRSKKSDKIGQSDKQAWSNGNLMKRCSG